MTSTTGKRDWWTFDRADRIGLQALLGLVLAAAVGRWLVLPIVDWVQGRRLAVPYFSDVDVPSLTGSGLGHSQADYSLLIPHATAGQRWLDLLPGVGYVLVVATVVWLVARIMGDICAGDPFQQRNVRRLRWLAVALVFGWTIVGFARATCSLAILDGLDLGAAAADAGPRAALTIELWPVLVGAFVALLAEAFRAGARLRDDVDGLI